MARISQRSKSLPSIANRVIRKMLAGERVIPSDARRAFLIKRQRHNSRLLLSVSFAVLLTQGMSALAEWIWRPHGDAWGTYLGVYAAFAAGGALFMLAFFAAIRSVDTRRIKAGKFLIAAFLFAAVPAILTLDLTLSGSLTNYVLIAGVTYFGMKLNLREYGALALAHALAGLAVILWNHLPIHLLTMVVAMPLALSAASQAMYLSYLRSFTDWENARHAHAELIKLNAHLSELSRTDALTGILNRLGMFERLDVLWAQLRRNNGFIAIMLIDVDRFKYVNDVFGHTVGDECLKRIAQAIRGHLRRAPDIVARYGGEEFIAIVECNTHENARVLAQGVCDAVFRLSIPAGDTTYHPYVSVSIGLATGRPSELTHRDELIRAADMAMYEAKQDKGNCVVAVERRLDAPPKP